MHAIVTCRHLLNVSVGNVLDMSRRAMLMVMMRTLMDTMSTMPMMTMVMVHRGGRLMMLTIDAVGIVVHCCW